MSEFIFILLGGVLAWLGLSNRFLYASNFNPRSPGWLGLGAVLIYWGVRAWMKTARAARTSERTGRACRRRFPGVGGDHDALAGAGSFGRSSMILAAAGAVLVLRGFAGAVLSLRTS